ncbi:MAG TPA: murein L,D-transpeptidase catalytic domain family protein [Flavisolibacter sp.]|nr:murein L,D-transpeptidase catalytic domain family protein [Flavisolibacter sp.]
MTFFVFASKETARDIKVANSTTILGDSISDPKVVKSSTIEAASALLYEKMSLSKFGLSKEAFTYAYKGYKNLSESGKLPNDEILTVVDFSQSSNKKRMYILDVKDMRVLINTFVAHGRNSGLQYAENFSNTHESLQSSLGFYVTTNTYTGKHGLSLRLAGVDQGFNHNAMSRAIVVHGADYIGAHRVNAAYQGRSFGCPAVPRDIAPKVIDYIKNGTCLFIYKPDQKYLHGSRILND